MNNLPNLFEYPIFYKLDENKNALPSTEEEHNKQTAKMLIDGGKNVADEYIYDIHISTVWLGIDHNPLRLQGDLPLLFETMCFDGNYLKGIYMKRYSTWKEAEEGHKKAVEWVKNGRKQDE